MVKETLESLVNVAGKVLNSTPVKWGLPFGALTYVGLLSSLAGKDVVDYGVFFIDAVKELYSHSIPIIGGILMGGLATGSGIGTRTIQKMKREKKLVLEKARELSIKEREDDIKYNKLRANLWEIAADKSLSNEELIKKTLDTVGPALSVSRACHNLKTSDNKKIECVYEWLDDGVFPSIGTSWPYYIAKLFFRDKKSRLVGGKQDSESKDVNLFIKGTKKLLDIDSVFAIPYSLDDELSGVVTFDVCNSKKDKLIWSESQKAVAYDVVKILSSTIKRKQVEEKVKENENKFRSIFNTMREGVCLHEVLYDPDGKASDYLILDANPSYESIVGINKKDVINKSATEVYGQVAFLDIYAKVAEKEGNTHSFEVYFPPMKKHFHISVSCPEKGTFVTVFDDITENKVREIKKGAILDIEGKMKSGMSSEEIARYVNQTYRLHKK